MNVLNIKGTNEILKNMFFIIQQKDRNQNDKNFSKLATFFTQIDEIILDYKGKLMNNVNEQKNKGLNQILEQKLLNFINVRSNSLSKMFTKTFLAYGRTLDFIETKINNHATSFRKNISNSQNVLEARLAAKKNELDAKIRTITNNGESEILALMAQREEIKKSLAARLQSEVDRLGEHYKKIVQQREDSLNVTAASLEKASEDLKGIVQNRKSSITAFILQNEQILQQHRESIESRLFPEEQKAKKLEDVYHEVLDKHQSLGPELDKEWTEKSSAKKEQFSKEDEDFELNYSTNKSRIIELQALLNQTTEMMNEQSVKLTNDFKEKIEYMEKRLLSIIENREYEILSFKEEYEAKTLNNIKTLELKLEEIKAALLKDTQDLKEHMDSEEGEHQKKVNAIRESHAKSVIVMKNEIDRIINEQAKCMNDWKTEKERLIWENNNQIQNISSKKELEIKFFNYQMDTLRKELCQILVENQEFEGTMKNQQKEIPIVLESISENGDPEKPDLSVFESEIKEKLNNLKEKHQKERIQLIEEVEKLENREIILKNIILNHNQPKTVMNDNESSPIQRNSKRLSQVGNKNASIGKVSSAFTSSLFLDSQVDKWREDFFVDCKSIKQEEADALKLLEESKLGFQKAVEKTQSLKMRLETATKNYTDSLKIAREKNEDELTELRKELEKKEREISELEHQFDDNESEIRKRVKLIGQAEDKISHLRYVFAQEKEKIKEIIKKEYQPLIQKEKEKSQEIVSDLQKLRHDLELSIEYMQNDLFLVETSNSAMEDGLRKETLGLVLQLKSSLKEQYNNKEDEYRREKSNAEIGELNKLSQMEKQYAKLENDEIEKFKESKENLQVFYKGLISEINDKCIEIISQNSEIKSKINYFQNKTCEQCPVLSKHMKKLENSIVSLQSELKDVNLDDQNKQELYQTFKPTSKPLSSVE